MTFDDFLIIGGGDEEAVQFWHHHCDHDQAEQMMVQQPQPYINLITSTLGKRDAT